MCDSRCSYCNIEEDWEHIILYLAIEEMQNQYVEDLEKKAIKVLKTSKDKELFQLIIQDIKTYLKGDHQMEFTTI